MAIKYMADELQHHLGYEIDMLNGSYALIATMDGLLAKAAASDIEKEVALNAMREDFCLHARGLLEFFTSAGTNSAKDFAVVPYTPAPQAQGFRAQAEQPNRSPYGWANRRRGEQNRLQHPRGTSPLDRHRIAEMATAAWGRLREHRGPERESGANPAGGSHGHR